MIRDAFAGFLRHAEHEKGLSPRTLQGYRESLEFFMRFIGHEDCSIPCLNVELIRAFLFHGKAERGWSGKTYHIHHSNLGAFCKWLMATGHLPRNPLLAIQKPKLTKPIIEPLEQGQVHKILYAALLKSAQMPFLRLRNHALLMLPLHSGLRMSEVIALQIADLNLEGRTLHVRNGKGGKDRMVVITDELVSILRTYLKEHETFYAMETLILFPSKSGGHLTPREFRRITDKVGELAGVKFASHDLRRSYATSLSRNNVSPFIMQRQLGHSDIRVTMRYVHNNRGEIEKLLRGISLY